VESALQTDARQKVSDLRSAPVDDHYVGPVGAFVAHVLGEVNQDWRTGFEGVESVAANLHDETAHGVTPDIGRPVVSSRPVATFQAWTA